MTEPEFQQALRSKLVEEAQEAAAADSESNVNAQVGFVRP
jgi:hypothetical protein